MWRPADLAEQLALGLYESLLDGEGLLQAVRAVADTLSATSHARHAIRFQNERPVASEAEGRGGLAGPALDDYARYWVRHDPWAIAMVRFGAGVHDFGDIVSTAELQRSRFWNEWGRREGAALHGLGVVLDRAEERMTGLGFHRAPGRPPFAAADRALLEALAPHLRRVHAAEARLATRRGATGAALSAGLDALQDGVALLDEARRLVFANAALRAMAERGDGLALAAEGGLAAFAPAQRVALARAVTAALAAAAGQVGLLASAGVLALTRPSGAAPWLVRALPVLRLPVPEAPEGFRGAMLIVTETDRKQQLNAALLGRLFGLTPMEAALAVALAAGRSPPEHAAARGISGDTVKSQLAAIRRKTGCRRLSDLTALLARLPG
jgi:DNA-binding CsgD family transcriptional regulator/PAS domain-containing protein